MAKADTAPVATHALTKHFGSVAAVDGLTLEVEPGEVFGFLGPNGAGKTTSIRMLLAFLRPTRGSAAGALRGGLDQGRLHALLERFELDPPEPFAELSTRNRRKVGIVQAFVHRPELLILDEPHRVAILRRGELATVTDVTELRAAPATRIDLQVAGDPDPSVFADVPSVLEVRTTAGGVHLVVEGSVDAVVKAAARMHVERIATSGTDLEEVFLDHVRADRP